MDKFWKQTEPGAEALILIKDNCVYKGNLGFDDLNKIQENKIDPAITKQLFGIPFSLIRKVENQKGLPKIKIYFGSDSEEELKIINETTKAEIFNYFKDQIPNMHYWSKLPSIFKYAKAPLFALLFSTGIFLLAIYYAIQLQNGAEYVIRGGRAGIGALALLLGNLGIPKLSIGYSLILIFVIRSLWTKIKSRSEIEYLTR